MNHLLAPIEVESLIEKLEGSRIRLRGRLPCSQPCSQIRVPSPRVRMGSQMIDALAALLFRCETIDDLLDARDQVRVAWDGLKK